MCCGRDHIVAFRFVALLFPILLLSGCGGGGSIDDSGRLRTPSVSGFVFKGPVSSGKISVYKLDDTFRRGNLLALANTDDSGAFSLSLPPYSGHLLLVASSGNYTEEALGVGAKLDGAELQAVIPNYRPGTTLDGTLVTPVSHLAAALAGFWTDHESKTVQTSMEEAWVRLNNHFGRLDWRTVKPTDFNRVDRGVQLTSDADRAGLLLAALSQHALNIATRAGVTPGSGFSTMDFINGLAADLRADGFFDGIGVAGPIFLPQGVPSGPAGTKLDGQTMRATYALAVVQYLQNARNHSGLTFADSQTLINAVSSNSDNRIFRGNGQQFDLDPPVLTLVTPPPRYTNASTCSFQVLALDPDSGVAKVYAQLGSVRAEGTLVSGTRNNGVYSFTMQLSRGSNNLTVWGEDAAGNSGLGRGAPNELFIPVTLDNLPKIPNFAPIQSYFSERNLRVQTDGSGIPGVPPIFQVPTGEQKQTLFDRSVIWKVSTRLSWGSSTPTGMDLENGNLNGPNAPFLQFFFPYVADRDAPISEVRYTIAASCMGCSTFAPATGNLIPAARTGPQQLYFDLPLTRESIPALAQMKTSPLNLTVSVNVTDAAGNTGTLQSPITLEFRVLGAPLAVFHETSYATVNDPRSVFPYRVAAGTYHQSWSPNSVITFDSSGQANVIRVMRYLIRNPHVVAVPVANFSGSGTSWVVNEQWDEEVMLHYTDSWPFEGNRYYTENRWQIWPVFAPYIPCDRMLHDQYYYIYPGYPYLTPYPCRSNPPPTAGPRPPAIYTSSSAISLRAYKNPEPSGAERDLADSAIDDLGASYFQVPAAIATTPGILVVYVVRPFIPSRTPGLTSTLNWQTLDMFLDPAYRNYVQDFWSLDREDYCIDVATPRCFISFAYRNARKLAGANEVLAGRLDFASATMRTDGRVLNELNPFGSTALPYTVPH